MMKIAICHYSFHRSWAARKWDCLQFAQAVRELGVPGIDFHVRFLATPENSASRIKSALKETGLTLSSLSMSNNFNETDPTAWKAQVDGVLRWLPVAAEVGAPISRIFGGHGVKRQDPADLKSATDRMMRGLEIVLKEAEKLGVVLGLENHGGLPALSGEQVSIIRKFNSPSLRATVDIGNYMMAGEEGHVGTAKAASLAGYVHIKDYRKIPDATVPWGYKVEGETVGKGVVDVPRCLTALLAAGYDGFLGLEYEGKEDDTTGVPASLAHLRKALNNATGTPN